jgi:dTDP-4-dehydrorhamnose reductase
MTTVVTGANGLVGSRIVARLLKDNERVVGVGRGPVRDAALGEYVEIDLLSHPRKLGQLIESLQPQGVIHAAAMTDVDGCESAPVEAWALNVRSVEEAALACAGISARFTAVSTDYVFDGAKGDYVEEDAPNPRGVYARTKRAGEEAALLLAPGAAVCRVAVVYSGRKGAKKTFEMVIGVHRSGAPGMFHCAGATQSTRVEFCRALARKLRADEALIVPVLLSDLKLPAPRPLRCGLRVEKVQRLLGHSVPLPLDAALDRFLEERAGG